MSPNHRRQSSLASSADCAGTFANRNMKKITVSFRFLTLTPKQGLDLKASIPGSELGRHFKSKKLVGCVPLTGRTRIVSIIDFAEAHGLKPKDCDIFVSVSTEKDTLIVDVPRIVNQMIRRMDCQVVFSFTCA
jgi:hypothetical protein